MVIAVDIGDPIHPSLRDDPRVVYLPETDARTLTLLPETPDVTLIDVTFASLPEILTQVLCWMNPGGNVVALLKPPYEVEGPAGKIRGETTWTAIIDRTIHWSEQHGLFRAVVSSHHYMGSQLGSGNTYCTCRWQIKNKTKDAMNLINGVQRRPLHIYEILTSGMNISLVMFLEGSVTPEAVVDAFRLTRIVHPYFRMKITQVGTERIVSVVC